MKTTALLLILIAAGCSTAPKNLYVHPDRYNCDLIIPTIWDGNHPVAHFEHKLIVGFKYNDYMGTEYTLVETETPGVYALRVQVSRP